MNFRNGDGRDLLVVDLDTVDYFKDGDIPTRVLVKSEVFSAALISLAPHSEIDVHESLADACIEVLRGYGAIETDEGRRELTPGSFAFIPSHVRHSVIADERLVFLLCLSHFAKRSAAAIDHAGARA